jgi:uncharacterized caspase-like protein
MGLEAIMRCFRRVWLWSCVILVALLTNAANAERRVAFVVGNGAYKHTTVLPNPPLDARAMASLLRNVGFEVIEGADLDRAGMTAHLREFAIKTAGADVALFFYAGHGIAVNGKNYLIPIDADLNSELDVTFGAAIDVDATLDQTMADAKTKLVFLDACRDNPFANKIRSASRTRAVTVLSGLVEMKSGEGTLIAFATGPGQKAQDGRQGENSPFTHALLSNIAEPGVEIRHALTKVRAQVSEETRKQQLPWENTNLTGFVYLNQAAVASVATAGVPGPGNAAATPMGAGSGASNDIELEFWRSVRDSDKAEELSGYLSRYPNGNFASIARARLAALQAGAVAKPADTKPADAKPADDSQSIVAAVATRDTEEKLGFDQRKRADLQKRLSALGYFEGSADGNFSDNTRRAIERWQTARRYPKTGYFNKLQHDALLAERLPVVRSTADRPAPSAARQPAQATQAPAAPPPPVAARPAVDPAGAAFMGGVLGGAIGGALRR